MLAEKTHHLKNGEGLGRTLRTLQSHRAARPGGKQGAHNLIHIQQGRQLHHVVTVPNEPATHALHPPTHPHTHIHTHKTAR